MITQEVMESFSLEEQSVIVACLNNSFVIQAIRKQVVLDSACYGMIDDTLSDEKTVLHFRSINSRIRFLEELADSFSTLKIQE